MSLSARKRALVGRLRKRSTREREGLFLVEGLRGAREALDKEAEIRFAVCSQRVRANQDGPTLLEALDRAEVEVSWTDDRELDALSDTESPQGVLLVCREPAWKLEDLDTAAGVLVLDGLQDPGNVGTLVRAASAFGLGGVVALEGTVDPWNPKVVRAAAGAVFSIPVLVIPFAEVQRWLEVADTDLVVSEPSAPDVASYRPAGRWALAVGNEGAGVRPSVARAARARVGVPMSGDAESLNAGVAGAILMYVLTQSSQRAPRDGGRLDAR
jgi:TrmH family RNA methyltransferase